MAMAVGSANNTYAAFQTQKTRKNSQVSKSETSREDYIKELQKKIRKSTLEPEIQIELQKCQIIQEEQM